MASAGDRGRRRCSLARRKERPRVHRREFHGRTGQAEEEPGRGRREHRIGQACRRSDRRVGGDTSFVYALEADGSKLYAGGGFSKVNGVAAKEPGGVQTSRPGRSIPAWKPATSEGKCTNPKCSPKVRALELGPKGDFDLRGWPVQLHQGFQRRSGSRDRAWRALHTAKGNLHPWKIPAGTINRPQTAWDLTATGRQLYGGFGSGPNFVAAFRLDKGNSGSQVWRFRTVGNVQTVALARMARGYSSAGTSASTIRPAGL